MSDTPVDKVRLDKWLWAARFFKTRALASEAVTGGKVHVNGKRVKSSRHVLLGDELSIVRSEQVFVIIVRELSGKRGPAGVAQMLYRESAESKKARAMREQERVYIPNDSVKPNKRERRRIIQFIEKQ